MTDRPMPIDRAPPKVWPFWRIEVQGYPPYVIQARSRGAAFSDAFRSYSECREVTFRDFLRIARVRPAAAPADDGYGYVRRAYGIDLKVGQRLTLRGDHVNPDKLGTVLHPNRGTTNYIHLVIDGHKFGVVAHPMEVILASAVAEVANA